MPEHLRLSPLAHLHRAPHLRRARSVLVLALATLVLALAGLVAAPAHAATSRRAPSGSVGLGIGMTAPNTVLAPDSASARVRFNEKFTLEPLLRFGTAASSVDTTFQPSNTKSSGQTSGGSTGVGASVRYAFMGDGVVDALVLGGVGFTSTTLEDDPPGDDNAISTKIRSTSVVFGGGLEHWINPHWSLSFDALAVSYATTGSKGEGEESSGETSDTQSDGFSMSVATQPTIRASIHLYL